MVSCLVIVTLSFIVATEPVYAHTTVDIESAYKMPTPKYTTADIKDRLNNLSTVLDIEYTQEVGKRIREYTVSYRVSGEKILGKVDIYFPIFNQEINRRGLPAELKYVAVVESHLNPNARSKSGAVGLWQFMKSTARMQGLEINELIDERKDPVKSTAAALDYLEYLHGKFGDWTLAIAAYNCGPGNVRKAIRRGGSKDYWKIRKHMPKETQKYVPRIIAAMYLMQYYHVHNLSPNIVDEDKKFTVSIEDGQRHNFKELAENLNVDYDLLRELNPQYRKSYYPSNNGHLSLVIPASKSELYMKHYSPISYKKLLEKRELRKQEAIAAKKEEELKLYKRDTIGQMDQIEAIELRTIYSEERQTVNISL